MTADVRIVPAAEFSLTALADIFTRSFEAYFYPGVTTAEILARRIREEQIDLAHSLVLLQNGAPAGQALLALRGNQAWCGGFGIMLPQRGKGLSRHLISALVVEAQQCGVTLLRLEVLSRNAAAIRTYQGAGLQPQHDWLILEWTAATVTAVELAPIAVRPLTDAELAQCFDAFHPIAPAWQRSLPTLLVRPNLQSIALERDGAVAAYLLFTSQDEKARIQDLGARQMEDALVLLRYLQQQYEQITSVNEPEHGPLTTAYFVAGFREIDRQHEMLIRF